MLYKAVPESVATLLRDIHHWSLPARTYLAGGTAVAIYLDHRVSVDIDLFTEEDFYCGPIISSIEQNHAITVTNVADRDTLIANVDDIKFSLFHYPYPPVKPLVTNPAYDIEVASPEDIAAMKAVAIVQRGIAKDFVDLRALMLSFDISLNDLMTTVQEKYRASTDYSYQVKKSLVYFDDAVNSLGDVTMLKKGQKVRLEREGWKEIEKYFKGIVFSQ